MEVNGILWQDLLIEKNKPELSFNPKKNYEKWKENVRGKFIELTGLNEIAKNVCDPQIDVESVENKEGYRQIKFTFLSEIGAIVPCYLLIPDTGKDKYPVAIVLAGHNTGHHNSIGVQLYQRDFGKERAHVALQAVREGYIALAIDQRSLSKGHASLFDMQYRNTRFTNSDDIGGCYFGQFTGWLLGRTLIGERCWDVKRAIDILPFFPECDTDKILIMGSSGGGTASYYAAAYDERIKICVPICSLCTFKESIFRFYHCSCNYIPKAYKYFDMQDISCLIAPRELVIINGEMDTGFLIEGARKGFETVKKVYKKAKAQEFSRLVIMPYGHYLHVPTVWGEIRKSAIKLGWIK